MASFANHLTIILWKMRSPLYYDILIIEFSNYIVMNLNWKTSLLEW